MCNQYHKSNCFIFWKNNYTENKLIKCYSNSKQNCLRVNPLYKPNHELSSLNNPMQHTIKKSKTPQGIEPRPNKWECHHRSLLLFCCCCKGKSKTWRNKRIVPPGKENPFTMAATLSRHEGTFRDTRLQLEDRTTGFPPPNPGIAHNTALATDSVFSSILLARYHNPWGHSSCIALEILQVSRDTQGQRRLSCLLCSCKRRKRNNLCALPPPQPLTSTAGTRFSQNGHRLPQTSSVYCGYSSSATLNSSFTGNKTVP